MSEPAYHPTRIRRLYVRGYRSIRELSLVDLPSIVVLHGENGAGKSNILRAMAMPLRWFGNDLRIAGSRKESAPLDYRSADLKLGIRRDDFNRSAPHEMQFQIELELGSEAQEAVGALPSGALLEIDVTVQDVGNGIRWWATRVQVGPALSLTDSNTAQQEAEIARLADRLRVMLRYHLVRGARHTGASRASLSAIAVSSVLSSTCSRKRSKSSDASISWRPPASRIASVAGLRTHVTIAR